VANGVEALAAVRQQTYDVVLMDVQMPEMDGLQAARLIGEEHGTQRPRIIAMTANAMHGDRERSLAAGMDDYLAKPIRISELQAALTASGRRVHGRHQRQTTVVATPAAALPRERREAGFDEMEVLDPTAFDETREFLEEEAEEVITGLIDAFRVRAPEMLQALRQACTDGERPQIELVAHTLKGFAGTVGARRVQALCETLESRAATDALNDMDGMLDQLENELGRVAAALTVESASHSEQVAERSRGLVGS
jgi:CheY-like chemotaxis protein